MDHNNLFSGNTKAMESRTKFRNGNFNSFRGNRGDFNNVYFDGYQSRNANCNMFNQRNMFEYMNGYNGFTGRTPNSFMGNDRDFTYARGRGSMMPTGGTAPSARAVAAGDDICDQPKCGNMGGVYRRCRKNGCTCTDMSVPNGECVSEKSRRGQIGIAQQKKMGLRDASGRKVNLTPQQVAQKLNSQQRRNFTGVNRVFPEGRGNYFSGRDMSNGGFRLR